MQSKPESTLLIVDDEPDICRLLKNAMGDNGYEVMVAGSGEEALRIAAVECVDFALVDIGLPGMSGIELTRRLVKTTNTVVLLMTGDDLHYSHQTATAEGAMDFIVKPIRLTELPLRIERARELMDSKLSREKMISELERKATVDELTQLLNSGQFFARLESEIAKSRRYGRPLTLAMLDIDHFKDVNDRYGHPVGDQVLRHVAAVLSGSCRSADTAFRYGGEEFALLLPETGIDHGVEVVERARAHVAAAHTVNGEEIVVTISGGVAELSATDDPDGLVERADEALYGAKRTGRNRVVRACSTPETSEREST